MSTPAAPTERFDVVMIGLDPERDRSEVLLALAQRLVKSTAEIETLLASAPSTLVRSLDEAAAQKIVSELRALGARVKPQTEAPEIAPVPPDAPPEKIQLLYWSAEDEGYERPARPTTAQDAPPEPRPPIVVLEDDGASPAPPPITAPAIVVKEEGAWHAPDSRSSSSSPSMPPKPATPSTPPPPSPARFGRASAPALDVAARPFFRALPSALVMPLRRPLRLLLSGLLAWSTTLSALFCLRTGMEVGPWLGALAVLSAVGGVGVILQSSASCLAATRLGEREPPPLPGRLMEDYLRPGLGVLVALGLLATLLSFVMPELAQLHVPRLLRLGTLAIATIYVVTGFVLSSASGSALGYADLFAMARLAVRSPVRASFVTLPTTAALIACGYFVVRVLVRFVDAPMPMLLVPTGISTLLALAAAYALSFSGAAMGTLLRASRR